MEKGNVAQAQGTATAARGSKDETTLDKAPVKEIAPTETVPQSSTATAPGTVPEAGSKQLPRYSTVSSKSNAPPPLAKPTDCKGRMIYAWKTVFNFFANDRIHGSIIGPHPTSFLFCCGCCYRPCKPECTRPFSYASISTKLQYFIMIIAVMIFGCFFIAPYPKSFHLLDIAEFYPCKGKKVNGWWGNCNGQGGYFFLYRIFLALNFYFFCMALTMIGVQSTTKNTIRKKMHHGFWLYKYLILLGLCLIFCLAIQVEGGGIFEIIMMSLGLLSTVFFSLFQLVFLLDILESAAIENQKGSKRKNIANGLAVGIVTVISLIIFGCLCAFYTVSWTAEQMNSFHPYIIEISKNVTQDSKHHHIGDVITKQNGKPCLCNVLCIVYLLVTSVIILAVNGIFRARLPPGSWLGSVCVILYNILLIWSALENQEDFACRPLWRESFAIELNPGNMDTYFKLEGLFHGVAALLALYYYVFWHGPRTNTAPLSIAFGRVMNRWSKRSEVPVLSDNRPTKEHLTALRKFRVWDDEQLGVTYSWSMFYVVLMLGSMTICSAMTNFSNPWANVPMSSSVPGLSVKIFVSVLTIVCYLWPILLPNTRCIRPDEDV